MKSMFKKIRYNFDNMMSSGTHSIIIALGVVTVVFLFIVSGIIVASGIAPEGENIISITWMSLMRTLDAGTMGGDTGSWPFLLSMLFVTVFGVFVVATLIGTISSGIEAKIDEIRKGKSEVIEKNHTVILGWSDRIFPIVEELIESNIDEKRPCIAILADRDKVEMEDSLKSKIENFRNTKIVCRSGNPMDIVDIKIINPDAAASIILISPEGDDPDTFVIKSLLALVNNPHKKNPRYSIICELHEQDSAELAHIIAKDQVKILKSSDVVARIVAQTCRQSGLSIVYTDLFSFAGSEIYFAESCELEGKTFAEAAFAHSQSSLIGLRTPDGKSLLNPPASTVLKKGDSLIIIAEDQSTIKVDSSRRYQAENIIVNNRKEKQRPEKIALIGWNSKAHPLVKELFNYIPKGSKIDIFYNSDLSEISDEILSELKKSKTVKISVKTGDTSKRTFLNSLKLNSYDSVILLGYNDTLDTQGADAKTLASLMHIRDIKEKTKSCFAIVSEILDIKNRDLAETGSSDDFILSDKIISTILAQLSENPNLDVVFEDLMDADGCEIYLKPAENYIKTGIETDFFTVIESCLRRGEIPFGYRQIKNKNSKEDNYGVVINPVKSAKVKFEKGDKILVISED